MRTHCIAVLYLIGLVVVVPSLAHARDGSDIELALRGGAAVAPAIVGPQRSAVMANAAATIVNHADVKGEFGEALARSQRMLGLSDDATYRSVPPRSGRQGIDALLLGVDANGTPNGKVMVIESKFSKRVPKLGMTKDGFQGSRPWVERRLRRIAADLARVARVNAPVAAGQVQEPKGSIQVALPNGKRGWVQVDGDQVLTNLTEAEFRTAQREAGLQFRAIRSAVRTGQVDSKVMWVRPEGGGYKVTVADVPRSTVSGKAPKVDALPRTQSVFLRAADFKAADAAIASITTDLRKKCPHLSAADCRQIARDMFDQGKLFHETVEMSRVQQWAATARMAAVGGAVPMLFAVGTGLFDVLTGEQPDWAQLAVNATQGGAAAVLGTGAGVVVTSLAIEQPSVGRAIARVGECVGLRPLPSYRIAGGLAGGTVAAVALAAFQYLNGDIDGDGALLLGGVGVGTTLVVAAAEMATMATIAGYATASSGAAISSLSGVAATNASLAWLGGGAASAGGFGMAGGAIVLTAGGAVIAIAAGWAFVAMYQTWDASKELASLKGRIEYMDSNWDRVLSASPTWKSVNLP